MNLDDPTPLVIDGFDAIRIGGRSYRLDRKVDDPSLKSALPRFREAYSDVPEANWVESDQFATFNTPVLDQVQNGCVGHGGCSMAWNCWVAAGNDPEDFSPTWLYALTNGGRDAGASIGDLLPALQKYGICTATSFPESQYFARQANQSDYAEAAQYVLDDGYLAYTWEEVGTALHLGYQVADSVMVGNSFMRVQATVAGYGVVPDNRGPGNHCVVSGGLLRSGGAVYRIRQTSWGTQTPLGPFGRFLTTKAHDLSQGNGFSAVVARTMHPGPKFVAPTIA